MTVSTDRPNLPDYPQLVKFLFKPFVSAPEEIGVDCEYTIERHRVWIRVAVAEPDRGSAFGRGGRNLQAIRTVLQAAAASVGQSVHLDVYGSNSNSYSDADRSRDDEIDPERVPSNKPRSAPPTRRAPDGEDRRNGEDRPNVAPPRRR
ncbi:KH domain-containing protein [Chamaesiphon sp.]|uniref:KH domain-containing protein n=1 Tax=Chamaesiphon sp. TaxID=2814140 RepID=UPI003594447C